MAARRRPAPPARRRALGLGAARCERQRQQQFVLDQRHRIERRVRQHHLVLVILLVDPRQLALVAREQQQRRLLDRPPERLQAALAGERHRARQRHLERGPPGGVGAAGDPVADVRRSAVGRQQVGHPRQRGGVDATGDDRVLRGNGESVEVALRFHWTMHCPCPPPGGADRGRLSRFPPSPAGVRCPRPTGAFESPLGQSIKNVG